MKIELTKTGWNEITTKCINIDKVHPFMKVSAWVECNERQFPKAVHRHHCQLCKTKWRDVPAEQHVYLAMTDKGNRTICHTCVTEYEKRKNNG